MNNPIHLVKEKIMLLCCDINHNCHGFVQRRSLQFHFSFCSLFSVWNVVGKLKHDRSL